MKQSEELPVVIIGAGPVGLAAAAHLSRRKLKFLVLERGSTVAANVQSWAHVSLFSPWEFNVDESAVEILERHGWGMPDPARIPSGQELIARYLQPLSETGEIRPQLRFEHRVVAVSRLNRDKMKDAGRDEVPFVIHVETPKGRDVILASAVIDASGTWGTPNPLGADGLIAPGELEHQSRIFYGIPDVLGVHRERYQNKTVAVVGSGHSAINTVLDLAELKQDFAETRVLWIMRKRTVAEAYGGLDQDELPGRGEVGQSIKASVDAHEVEVITPIFIERISGQTDRLLIVGTSGDDRVEIAVDEIVGAAGLRPDLTMLRELRLALDDSVESPEQLAPMIAPNIHSCGTVAPHGVDVLRHPEKDFYIAGMKSYGRASTFLMKTGYEQVRSVVAAIAGDWKSAREVHLVLPETGVCSVSRVTQLADGALTSKSDTCCC
jgi:thioredoxin reductase